MKIRKTFKSVIALALAFVLSLGVVSTAFAVNIDDTVEWEYEGDFGEYVGIDEYTYKGELVEGANTINGDDYSSPCYTFNAEKSGYYLFSSENGLFSYVSEEIIRDDIPYGYADSVSGERAIDEESDEYYDLFYIPEGTVYVGLDFYGDYARGTLEIEYLGAELTDVSVDENELKDLIRDWDIGYGSGKGFYFQTDTTFTFDEENEVVLEGAYLRLDTPDSSEVVDGENIVKTINTFGIEKEYTLTCYPIEHYISKIEITNLDKYLTYKRYYNEEINDEVGFYYADDGKGIAGETLTVTLCDGTTQSFVLDWDEDVEIELPNGRKVDTWMYQSVRDGSVYLVVNVCGVNFLEGECTPVDATAEENLDMLKSRIERRISSMNYWVDFWISRAKNADSITDIANYIRYAIDEISYYAKEIFTEIGDCCGHLILG